MRFSGLGCGYFGGREVWRRRRSFQQIVIKLLEELGQIIEINELGKKIEQFGLGQLFGQGGLLRGQLFELAGNSSQLSFDACQSWRGGQAGGRRGAICGRAGHSRQGRRPGLLL